VSSETVFATHFGLLLLQTAGQAPAAKKQKKQKAVAATFPSFEAQHLATAFVQYILPEGAYNDPRQAAIDLLQELAALPEPEADVEAKVAQCARCAQTLMGQAWEVIHQLTFLRCWLTHASQGCKRPCWGQPEKL